MTTRLIHEATQKWRVTMNELLLSALAISLQSWTGK